MANNSRALSDSLKLPRAALFACFAIIAAVAAAILASRYPLPFLWKAVPLLAYGVLLWMRPEAWLLIIPAILPVSDLAPWTGWLFVEELDLFLLVTLAVGYFRTAARPATIRLPGGARLLFGLLAVSYLISAARVLVPLPIFDANALSNYASPYNALHIAKGFFWAWFLMPLLTRTSGAQGENLKRWFFPGVIIGLIGICLVAIWERAAFPGFLNFSSDYRTTASFSAMHVGGAALDGFLALSIPFTCWLFLPERKLKENIFGLAILAAGTYALLTTFSRALYVGYALAAVILMFFLMRTGSAKNSGPARERKWGIWILPLLLVVLIWLLYRVFGTGGYRVLAAILIFLAGAFYVGGRTGSAKSRLWWPMALLPIAGLSVLAADMIPKGAYVIFGVAAIFLVFLVVVDFFNQGCASLTSWLCLALAWVGVTSLLVAMHWGGAAAVTNAILPIGLLSGVVFINQRSGYSLWRIDKRAIVIASACGVGLALLIPIAGNDYSHERFSRTGSDMDTRTAHWNDVLNVMTNDMTTTVFGMGLGRLPIEYFWRNTHGEIPGSFQYMNEAGNQFVRLAGPRYALGYGEVLRFGQRVRVNSGERYQVVFSFRATAPKTVLDIGLCEKHLLYNRVCSLKTLELQPADGAWHEVTADLGMAVMNDGPWYLPRPVQLWVANGNAGVLVDVDNLRLVDSTGRNYVRNGEFDRGNDFWFYSSDNYHLPWHAKNLWLNVYFDQGWFGLIVFSILLGYVLIHLLKRAWAGEQWAGIYLAAVTAFLAVGLFDSLIDVPRIATLFYLILLTAFCFLEANAGSKAIKKAI
ncbi:MAG: hypothetical protein V4568_05440 [Pseudomonadota bacterium]